MRDGPVLFLSPKAASVTAVKPASGVTHAMPESRGRDCITIKSHAV